MFNWLTRMVRASFVEGVRQGMADINPESAPATLEEFGRLVAAPTPALPAAKDDDGGEQVKAKGKGKAV